MGLMAGFALVAVCIRLIAPPGARDNALMAERKKLTQNVKLVGGVSEGTDAWIVSDILTSLTNQGQAADAMYVVRDDRRLEAALELLASCGAAR